jgi:pimeloyl-ACP methyl ester carboxylesterase
VNVTSWLDNIGRRWLRAAGFGVVAVAFAACTPGKPSKAPTGAPALPLSPCQLRFPGSPQRVSAQCGRLEVPERYDAPEGRRISLKVAVVEAERASKQPDPLYFLAGGPGQAATEQYPRITQAFYRVNLERDVVLVDQRGTGGSGKLRCENLEGKAPLVELSEEEELQALEACGTSMTVDVTQYTTEASARDLDRVRQALGHERLNLAGISYGTRLALVYQRLFPDRVRTMVLDGVAPVSKILGATFEQDAQAALDLMVKRCAAEAPCRGAFPSLSAEVKKVFAQVAAQPIKARVRHPVTGVEQEVAVTQDLLRQAVSMLSYANETIALLPLLLHTAAQGDFRPLAAQTLSTSEELQSSVSRPLNLSILCNEEVPFFPPALPKAETEASYLGDSKREGLRKACAKWPHRAVDASFRQPVRSEVPALLLSGEADPVTPPSNAEEAARFLPSSLQLVARGHGHSVVTRGCLPRLVDRFIKSGKVSGLETSCAQALHPTPFFLDFVGPPP